jgi:membrane-bound inhibitor of C-type lysozyme
MIKIEAMSPLMLQAAQVGICPKCRSIRLVEIKKIDSNTVCYQCAECKTVTITTPFQDKDGAETTIEIGP